MRYRITIDQGALDKRPVKDDPEHQLRPIRVYDTKKDVPVRAVRAIGFPMGAELVYGDPGTDGERVWIEADGYVERA